MTPTRTRCQPSWTGRIACAVLAATFFALAGCQALRDMSPNARKQQAASAKLLQQQAQNMRFADHYAGRLIEAVHGSELTVDDAAQRFALSGWLLVQANTAYSSASGENAVIGALDLVALATLSRMAVEDIAHQRFPQQADMLIGVHRGLEAESWKLTADLLTPAQQDEMRRFLVEWYAQHPGTGTALFMRFQEFVPLAPTQRAGGTGLPSSLIGLVGLDPLAGLDPAVRQVEQARLLGERAIYYAQRMPILIDLQLDRSLNRLAAGPESRRLMLQTTSMTSSAERFAAVAEALPAQFAQEREALVQQLTDLLTTQQATLTPMLIELRSAIEAGNTTAASVDQAVRSIDALVARTRQPPPPGRPPGRPFDVTEYTQAAAEITQAANQLQQLLAALGTQAPQLDSAVSSSVAQGRSLVDYLFVRVAWLIGLLLAGLLAVLLLYRWLAPRARPT